MVLIHLALALAAGARCALAQKYLFAFGDSYTATGFYIYGTQPSLGNPIGNPPWNYSLTYQNVQGTVCGGPAYLDWLVTQYNNSIVQGYNFAIPGATINNSIVTRNGPADLLTQISTYFKPQYSTPGNSIAPWNAGNSLFTLAFGINDIDLSWNSVPSSVQIPKLMKSYLNATDQLYQTGARNFVFLNVPPFDRSPYELRGGQSNSQAIANYIAAFNSALKTNVTSFLSTHSGATIKIYDYNTFMSKVLNAPTTYGFQDATCEAAGYSKCVWWRNSDLHTTTVFQRVLAADMANSGTLGTFATTGNPAPPAVSTQSKSVNAFCPTDTSENYTAPSGDIYNIQCQWSFNFGNPVLEQSQQASLQACIFRCSTWNQANSQKCLGANYYQPGGTCYLQNSTANQAPYDVDSGILLTPPSVASGVASSSAAPSAVQTASTVALASPTSNANATSASTATCPGDDGTTYTDSDGISYKVLCSTNWDGSLLLDSSYTSSLATCLLHCSDYNKQAGKTICLGATFYPSQYNCWTINATTTKYSNAGYNSGQMINPTTSSVASKSPTSSAIATASPSPSSSATPSSNATCPGDDGTTYTDSDGISYKVLCSTNWDGSLLLDSSYTSSLATCLLHCSDYNKQAGKTICLGATFYPSQYNCWTINATTTKYSNPGYNSGQRIGS